jgi:hypothetical protein
MDTPKIGFSTTYIIGDYEIIDSKILNVFEDNIEIKINDTSFNIELIAKKDIKGIAALVSGTNPPENDK